jgi:mono/diheme cytochrome c family protein
MMMRFTHRRIAFANVCTLVVGLLAIVTPGGLGWTQTANHGGESTKQRGDASAVARGKYIAEGVAVCAQCHTPRDNSGALDRTKWLQGAPVWLKPAIPVGDWPLEAPRIAGLVPGSDDDMIKLLTTGTWRDGKRLRPPMPQFRLSRQDAEAVVAYLRSASPSATE